MCVFADSAVFAQESINLHRQGFRNVLLLCVCIGVCVACLYDVGVSVYDICVGYVICGVCG